MHSSFGRTSRKILGALLCAAAFIAAGCHGNDDISGYGIGFVTLTGQPANFATYTVNVDSVTVLGVNVGEQSAVPYTETVDFTKLTNIAELWDTASIPNDTYTQATITLDYTAANISVFVNGVPRQIPNTAIFDSSGTAATTMTVTVALDPSHLLALQPTYATTSAERLAINFDLAASNVVNLAANSMVVKPFFTMATSAADNKLIRVRGPLINSSVSLGTYTVYVRPFYDEVDSLGSLSMFSTPQTSFLINGSYYTGAEAGVTVLSGLSAGTTMTAAYTTYQPSPSLNAAVTAAKFNAVYVIGGSTLEDFYTQGLEGDVIARNGNTLTVGGSTLSLNDGTSQYNNANAVVLLGPSTIVTADNNPTLTGLNYNSIAVGQHIIARGIYELPASGVVTLDSTGSTSTNTGSVRLISSEVFGTLVSSASGSLVLNAQTISGWPITSFNFAGNGASAAQNPVAASFVVDPGTATVPSGLAVGDPVWVDGLAAPFGTAPPDFKAYSIPAEPNVPASMQVDWTGTGTTAPFATLNDSGLTVDLANATLSDAVIRIGSETIDMKTLAASPQITPVPVPAPTPGLPDVFLPLFAVGNPVTAGTVATSATANTTTLNMYNTYATFVTQLGTQITASDPVVHFTANGVYNRASNTFTASSIDVVL